MMDWNAFSVHWNTPSLWSYTSGMMEVEFLWQFTFQKNVGLDSEFLVECVLASEA